MTSSSASSSSRPTATSTSGSRSAVEQSANYRVHTPNGRRAARPEASQSPLSLWERTAVGLISALRFLDRLRFDGSTHPIHEMAGLLAESKQPREIDSALVRLAAELAGAERSELVYESRRGLRLLAWWPDNRDLAPNLRGLAETRQSPEEMNAQVQAVPLRFNGAEIGTLRLFFPSVKRPSAKVMRLVNTLAVMAASIRSDENQRRGEGRSYCEGTHDQSTGMPNETFLEGFLPYAIAQAKRRDEPFSMLCVSIDRLAAIRELHGIDLADEAIRRVGRIVATTLRTSDLVVRLDNGRLICLLPGTAGENAVRLAENLRTAVSDAGKANTTMPMLTVSMGISSYPNHATDAEGILAAAVVALGQARTRGDNQVIGVAQSRVSLPAGSVIAPLKTSRRR